MPIEAENSENVANVSSGKVVKKPAQPFDSPKSALIKGTNGPIAVIDGRRLNETNMIPRNKNPDLR